MVRAKREGTPLSVVVPTATYEALKTVSEDRMIGMGVIVAKALDEFLARLVPLDAALGAEPEAKTVTRQGVTIPVQ